MKRAYLYYGLAGVGLVAVFVRGRSGLSPLVGVAGQGAPSTGVARLAAAIATAEGFSQPGSIPARAHNPGNLKLGGPNTINGITVFASDAEGWAALYRQLNLIARGQSAYYSLQMTIREMGQTWTATVNEQLAWSRNVAGALGASVDTSLRSILV